MERQGIADYFVIAGVPEKGRKIDTESSPLRRLDPIVDIAVINRSHEEPIPPGYECIETTPGGHEADLNHGSIRSSSMFLCFKRGREKPPLIDIGVIYEDKENLATSCQKVERTPSGFPANVNNSGTHTYFTYRRSREDAPCNQLVVTNICVILQNKGEQPPHAFCLINKNLNKGFIGSNVFVCYKKSMDRPPYIPYFPEIIDRFSFRSLQYSFPSHGELFCLPMGASIECWPSRAAKPSPSFLTFVLTSAESEKLYGSTLNFYETISHSELTLDELKLLNYIEASVHNLDSDEAREALKKAEENKTLQRIKSIGILSKWPFFDQFKRFLTFLHRSYLWSEKRPLSNSLESYIFYFLKDIHFPLPGRPDIFVNLLGEPGEEELIFTQSFGDLPLPSNGASFKKMLLNLGPENCLHLLLFTLTEQKILIHSLRPSVLTEIAEAMITMIFPFYWHCPYIPMCPIMMNIGHNQKISMSDFLGAPMPFLVGIDSRYFHHNIEPPQDVASIDIDTHSIYLCETKRFLNLSMLPKREKETLLATLKSIYERIHANPQPIERNAKLKLDRQFEIEIQEAFLYFMAQILKDFRAFLKPITAAPRVGATDASSLFDIEGFLQSRASAHQPFYEALLRTQMFTRFIEERSLVSDKNVSLAFFDECIEKVEKHGKKSKVALIEYEDRGKANKTVFIAIPDSPVTTSEDKQTFSYTRFGPLDQKIFLRLQKEHGLNDSLVMTDTTSSQSFAELFQSELHCYSYAKRAKHEVRKSQRFANQATRSPVEWAKFLVYKSYTLWFTHFPAFSHFLRQSIANTEGEKIKLRPLSIAYEVLQRMQSMKCAYSDEFCYRIMMILCSIHSQPALAVKVFLNMRRYHIKLNAITYGYYNKAVLEGNWPSETRLNRWAKVRNVAKVVWHFKRYIKPREEEEAKIMEDSVSTRSTTLERNVEGSRRSSKATANDHLSSTGTLMLTLENYRKMNNDTPTEIRKRHSSLQEMIWDETLFNADVKKTTVENNKQDNVSERGENGDASFSRFTTPIKEAFNNVELFSPKNRFGLTLRSSLKMAKNLTKSSKYGFAAGTPEKREVSKVDSLPRVIGGVPSSETPVKSLHRSSTLPQTLVEFENESKSGMSTPKGHSNVNSSPWASKLSNSKHSEYVVSTFKMAANRWNELKFSLASVNSPSGSSSPVKLNMSNMMDRGSLLLSQLKNYAFEDGLIDNDKTYDHASSFDMFEEFDEATFDIEQYKDVFSKVKDYYGKPLESMAGYAKDKQDNTIIFRVEIISLTICRMCKANVFDEDIMARWTANDSNLNTSCPFCTAGFVPTLKIMIKDYRRDQRRSAEDFRELDAISVPYISPLVLHKELENLLHSDGYASLVETDFVDKHPIVFWNLVWYFQRINLPSHLPTLALYAKSLYGNQGAPLSPSATSAYDHRNVCIVCLWEKQKFYDVVPLYKQWFRSKSICAAGEVDEEKKRSSQKIYQEIIALIKDKDLMKPIQFLISIRKTTHASGKVPDCTSIYRELLFLALSELNSHNFEIDAFDSDYKTAFELLPAKEREATNQMDKPLQIGSIFCRNMFRQLSLESVDCQTR